MDTDQRASSPIQLPKERSNWKKVFSESKQRHYWFNQATGKTQWDEPAVHKRDQTEIATSNRAVSNINHNDKKRKRDEVQRSADDVKSSLPKIAVIVPFRDLHSEQKRGQQLKRFVPEMERWACRAQVLCTAYGELH